MAERPSVAPSYQISAVRSASDLEAVAQLFRAYAAALGIDLSFQNFASELATLPGQYSAPAGELLLARDKTGKPIGCVGLRPIEPDGCCEMKRLYVAPCGRSFGLGGALVDRIVLDAERIGHREMRLDTLPNMAEAIALYRRAGFTEIAPYYETPLAGTIFLGRSLARRPTLDVRPIARRDVPSA